MQSTFAIIKPDAVSRNLTGEILAAMEASGLKIVALKRLRLSKAQAEPGTLRHKYGQSLEANAVHGSDAAETAAFEIGYFFSGLEITE